MRPAFSLFVAMLIALPAVADEAASQQAVAFAREAAVSNLFEIEAAKIEIAKGKATDARQFAEDMQKDHGLAATVLADAAQQDRVSLPSELDDERRRKLDAIGQSDPSNLDQAYLSTQVAAHQQTVDLFQRYAQGGPDGALKRAAQKILPDLRMHLIRVQALTSNAPAPTTRTQPNVAPSGQKTFDDNPIKGPGHPPEAIDRNSRPTNNGG